MNREDIIRMAREAGAMFDHMTWVERDLAPVFERFAALVAAAAKAEEREACAKVAWEYGWRRVDNGDVQSAAVEIHDAIRARGQA